MADAPDNRRYRAEDAGNLHAKPLDELSLIYHRRSGMTHIVASPVPEMLAVMGGDVLGAKDVLQRLSRQFDLDAGEEQSLLAVVVARLEELAALGLLERL